MLGITMVAHFTEPETTKCSGLRDISIPIGLAHQLHEYFGSIRRCNAAKFPYEECGISKLIGNTPQNLFIVQNNVFFKMDVSGCKVIYFHIDGTQSFHPNEIDFAIYLFNALGKHAYKVAENQKVILPFASMNFFNPSRTKNINLSDISRDVSHGEYKDILERSDFTIVNAPNWISKRALEALACKTVPIILTNTPEMYYRMGFQDDFCKLMKPTDLNPTTIKEDFDLEKGYNWVKQYHSAKVRVKQLLPYLKKYFN